jgi:hypothetical protein
VKYVFGVLIVMLGGGVGFVSVVFGALLLTSANGPTKGNWIASYAFMFGVPLLVLLVCFFLWSRTFR